MNGVDPSPAGPGQLLMRLLETELRMIPLAHWGFMFPGHVAVWKFIENSVPGVLGPLTGRYDVEPSFEGEGADWFVAEVIDHAEYLDLLDVVMRSAVDQLRQRALYLGFVESKDRMVLPMPEVEALAELVLSLARDASVQAPNISRSNPEDLS